MEEFKAYKAAVSKIMCYEENEKYKISYAGRANEVYEMAIYVAAEIAMQDGGETIAEAIADVIKNDFMAAIETIKAKAEADEFKRGL